MLVIQIGIHGHVCNGNNALIRSRETNIHVDGKETIDCNLSYKSNNFHFLNVTEEMKIAQKRIEMVMGGMA